MTDDQQLWTTAEAAAVAGVQPDSWRGLMRKARSEGIDLRADRSLWPDQRTPVYVVGRTLEWLGTRPRGGPRNQHANRTASTVPGAEITQLIAVVPHPDRVDPDALRESLAQSGYRVGDVSIVLREALSDQEKTTNG